MLNSLYIQYMGVGTWKVEPKKFFFPWLELFSRGLFRGSEHTVQWGECQPSPPLQLLSSSEPFPPSLFFSPSKTEQQVGGGYEH